MKKKIYPREKEKMYPQVRKSTALAERKAPAFDPEMVLVVRQMFNKLTDGELKVYLGVCRKYHADPIMKNIVPVVFNTKDGRVLNFIITRDFLIQKANQNDKLDGLQSKVVRDDKGNIIGATATCWKKGSSHSFDCEVSFKEYYNAKNDLWGKFPGAMICKVAEVIVLKRAFGINMPCDIELEKNGGGMIRINDIEVPKQAPAKFVVSDDGEVKKKQIKEPKIQDAEVM